MKFPSLGSVTAKLKEQTGNGTTVAVTASCCVGGTIVLGLLVGHIRSGNKAAATANKNDADATKVVAVAAQSTQQGESTAEKLTHYILTHHRSLVVTVFGLPMSCLWDAALSLRAKYIHYTRSAPQKHAQRVAAVVEQVRRPRPEGQPLCTARPGWQSISLSYRTYKSKWRGIDMNSLIDILDVDTGRGVIVVEPLVTMGQITHALLPLGYTLPIVPEMDDLTVGGLVSGTGIESSSHVRGLFHEGCLEFELCLADGRVVRATADNEYSDLFHGIPWSYGTLAFVLSVSIRIVPCKQYVRVEYRPFHSQADAIDCFRRASGDSALIGPAPGPHDAVDSAAPQSVVADDGEEEEKKEDGGTVAVSSTGGSGGAQPRPAIPTFVEGLVYSTTEAVIMTADFCDAADAPRAQRNILSRWYKPWFYIHVRDMLSQVKQGESVVEYIPLRDYYHRHTRSLFWEMEMMIPIGNHPVFRYLLGWLMPPKVSFLKLSQTEYTRKLTERTHVAQDFLVPTDRMGEVLDVCDKEYDGIYPLWLCPHVHRPMPGSLLRDPPRPDVNGDQMYVDIGVYGLPKCVHEGREEEYDMRKSMRAVEKEIQKVDGFSMLYADIYMNKKEFETMYDHVEYRKLRSKYGAAGSFKEVFDKMNSRF